MERVQENVRTPDVAFFIDLCRRYSQHDVRCAIEMTAARIVSSDLAWEQAEVDCRRYATNMVLRRAQQKVSASNAKRPVASVFGHGTHDRALWIQ
jgi:hypothetical protein